MIDALDTAHITGGNRMKRRDVLRMSGCIEAVTDRLQHQIGAAQTAGRRNGNDRAVWNKIRCLRWSDMFFHDRLSIPVLTRTADPLFDASTTASPVASDQMPSSAVAEGLPPEMAE
ncbi:hypothetical protein D3C86_1537270 [compost metagenome]